MFNIISIYSCTCTNSQKKKKKKETSLKITTFLLVQSTYSIYLKPLYNSHLPTTATFSKSYFAKAQEPAFRIINLLSNVFTLNIRTLLPYLS